ncbi:MAG: M4 family peptidase, partial [Phycicoccus sp.]|nr:M4 family peptidase [Phycicoccus sp.]
MNRLRTGLAFGALVALVAASSQGVAAFGASPPSPSRGAAIAAEQSASAAAGRALGLATGEKLVVRDVITDTDGSTHVRYDRTFDGLRVIGGDLVSHRDSAGTIQSVSWNASHSASVASRTPRVSLASAEAAGAGSAGVVGQSPPPTHPPRGG